MYNRDYCNVNQIFNMNVLTILAFGQSSPLWTIFKTYLIYLPRIYYIKAFMSDLYRFNSFSVSFRTFNKLSLNWQILKYD